MLPSKNQLYIWQGRILYAAYGNTTEPHGHYAVSVLISLDEPMLLKGRPPGVTKGDEVIELGEYRAVVLSPNFYHQAVAPERRFVVLQIDPDLDLYGPVGQWLGDAGFREVPFEQLQPLAVDFSDLFLGAYDCTEAGAFFEAVLHAITPEHAEARPPLDERIARIVQELKADLPPDQIAVSELAARAGLSEMRFMHVFKEELGLPVRRFILWLRLHKAAEFLKEGITLTEAAHAAGFSDSAHMSRVFKDNFGVQPSFFLAKNSKMVHARFCM